MACHSRDAVGTPARPLGTIFRSPGYSKLAARDAEATILIALLIIEIIIVQRDTPRSGELISV
jgi:hypothetical protein